MKINYIYKVEITTEKVAMKDNDDIIVYCLDIVRYKIQDLTEEKFDRRVTLISNTNENYIENLKPIVEDTIHIYDDLFKTAGL